MKYDEFKIGQKVRIIEDGNYVYGEVLAINPSIEIKWEDISAITIYERDDSQTDLKKCRLVKEGGEG